MSAPRFFGVIVALAVLAASVAPVRANEFELSLGEGRVTLLAYEASLKEILAEWGRIGNTAIIDADELTDERLSLELVDVPEATALRTLLRAAAGYMAAPRAVASEGASRFDRILIMATSKPAAAASAGSAMARRAPSAPMRSGSGQRLGVVPNAPRGRTPFTVSAAQQEQLDQLQALLQQGGDDDEEDEPDEPEEPVFGNLPSSLPGQVMSTDDGSTPEGVPTGTFGATPGGPTSSPFPGR